MFLNCDKILDNVPAKLAAIHVFQRGGTCFLWNEAHQTAILQRITHASCRHTEENNSKTEEIMGGIPHNKKNFLHPTAPDHLQCKAQSTLIMHTPRHQTLATRMSRIQHPLTTHSASASQLRPYYYDGYRVLATKFFHIERPLMAYSTSPGPPRLCTSPLALDPGNEIFNSH